MSESVSTDAGAAPAPAIPDGAPASLPPPNTQEGISISEAARLLRNQRRTPQQGQGGQPPAQASPESIADAMAKALGETPAEAQPGEQPPPAEVPRGVEIDGRRWDEGELRRQLSLAADYTQKTQALAEQQRQLQGQAEALAQMLPHIGPELAKLQQTLEGVQPPDESLITTDPQLYLHQQHAYHQALREQQRLLQLSAMQTQAQQQALARKVAEANDVLAKEFPSFWADPTTREAAQKEIVAWARTKGGYKDSELIGLADARHVVTMIKAMAYDRMREGTRTSAPMPTLAAPARGAPPPPPQHAAVQQAEATFNEKPNIRNAAALLTARGRTSNGSTPGY